VLQKESGLVSGDPSGKSRLVLNASARRDEPMPGQHIRPSGEEAKSGAVLLPAGTVLNPAQIALAAVAGHDELQVQARPLVAVILTGSEVVASGIPAPGQVRDTFGPQLGTVISLLGGTPGSTQRIGDSYEEWLLTLGVTLLSPGPDVTVTTGGTGQSGTDHFRSAVRALGGKLLLDGIAMRPGHPAVLAELPDSHFILGLPGNPLAAMMALLTVGEPLLAALGNRPLKTVDQVPSGTDLEPDPGRTRLIPCRIVNGHALPQSHAGPGMMRGLAWADAIMVVPPPGVQRGEPLPVVTLPGKEEMYPHPPADLTNQQGGHSPWDV
jgi:molybdopterin molybdotransferase